jgi:hypothetical protein
MEELDVSSRRAVTSESCEAFTENGDLQRLV